MRTAEVKRRFLAFFEANGHTVVPSAPLPAIDDPNLLFVNAGMVQFVPYFLGQVAPPFQRATSVQKVIRTPDIDEVGKTSRHGTFFQMNGNFSFGDYFKEEAIRLAWELSTKPLTEGGYGLDPERIWATVYLDDDEAIDIWKRTGLPAERIVRRGKTDNFWSMGIPGPCGPCSEIYVDRGPAYGKEGGPEVDEDRYLEIWNLVFMQEVLSAVRAKDDFDVAGELPSRNIDTGMGLERMAIILQGVDNIYEVDTMWKVLDGAAELTEQRYGREHRSDVALRIVADHVRTSAMLVSDGVLPSNEGRGYVLRRILRRSIRNLRLLAGGQRGGTGSRRAGEDERYLHELTDTAIDALGEQFPELRREAPRIHGVLDAEEAAFSATLRTGSAIFDAAVGEVKRHGTGSLTGEQAFQLHDTYGFPIDLTLEMAAEQGLTVDEDGFRRLM